MNVSRIEEIVRVGASRTGVPTWRIRFTDGAIRLTKRGSQVGMKVDESWAGRAVTYDMQYVAREGTRIVNIERADQPDGEERLLIVLQEEYHDEWYVGHGTTTSRECAECKHIVDIVRDTFGFN